MLNMTIQITILKEAKYESFEGDVADLIFSKISMYTQNLDNQCSGNHMIKSIGCR